MSSIVKLMILVSFLPIVCSQKETYGQVRHRIQAKLEIPEKEFEKVLQCVCFFFKFSFSSVMICIL